MTESRPAPANWQVAVPTVLPIGVAFYLVPILAHLAVGGGTRAIPIALVGACLLLVATAAWLNRVLVVRLVAFAPFVAAAVCVVLVWAWQWEAYSRLVPPTGLPYGYFLTPEGAQARLWVLVLPFAVGAALLLLCCVSAVICWWRSGARLTLLCMAPWWLAMFLLFALTSFYLEAQGDGSLFI